MRKLVTVAFVTTLVAGCASTRVTSIRDPSMASHPFYKRILVVAPFADLESRNAAEKAFIEQLTAHGVEGLSSLTVVPPTREYSAEELSTRLVDSGADGVLFVLLTDSYSQQAYVPGSSATTGSGTVYGNAFNYSSTTQHYGGYYVSKPRVSYELSLYDVTSGQKAWYATSFTRGNAFARFDTLINSLAQAATAELVAGGAIP